METSQSVYGVLLGEGLVVADAVPRRGMAVRGNVGAGRSGVHPVLQ